MVRSAVAMGRPKSVVARQLRFAFERPFTLEKIALLVQKVSGVGLLLFLASHIFVTATVTSGREAWGSVMAMLSNPLAHMGELLVVAGATFHAVNGIRVMLLELSPLVGKPARPDYPYKVQSLGAGQRSIVYVATLMAGLSVLVGIAVLWGF